MFCSVSHMFLKDNFSELKYKMELNGQELQILLGIVFGNFIERLTVFIIVFQTFCGSHAWSSKYYQMLSL